MPDGADAFGNVFKNNSFTSSYGIYLGNYEQNTLEERFYQAIDAIISDLDGVGILDTSKGEQPVAMSVEQRRANFWRVRGMTQTVALTVYSVLVGIIWSIIGALHHGSHHPVMGLIWSSVLIALSQVVSTGAGFLVYTKSTRANEDDLFLSEGSPIWKTLSLVTAPALGVQLMFEGTKKLEYASIDRKGQKSLAQSLEDHPFAHDVLRAQELMTKVEEELGGMDHLPEVKLAKKAAEESYRALYDIKQVVDEDSARIKAQARIKEAATLMQTRLTFDAAQKELLAEYHTSPAMAEIEQAVADGPEATEPVEVVMKDSKTGEYTTLNQRKKI